MRPGTGITYSADPELILQLQQGDLDALGGLCASISFRFRQSAWALYCPLYAQRDRRTQKIPLLGRRRAVELAIENSALSGSGLAPDRQIPIIPD